MNCAGNNWKLWRSKPAAASRLATSHLARMLSMRSFGPVRKSSSSSQCCNCRSSSNASNPRDRENTKYVTGSAWTPSICAPKLITFEGTRVANVRAGPCRPRRSAAACCENVTRPDCAFNQACTSQTHARNGSLTCRAPWRAASAISVASHHADNSAPDSR